MIITPAFWYGKSDKKGEMISAVLQPLSLLYGFLVRKRFDLYFPVPLGKPVICIGNLVAGGAGKTPVVMAVCDLLKEKGFNPHLLTRGYGGQEEGPLQVSPGRDTADDVGDEALLLVDHAPTWVSRNRPLGAQAAIDSGANVIVMDDGFQNPVIYKDFSLLVVDGAAGFGNDRLMPAGPLREPLDFGLSRAHAVLVIGEDTSGCMEKIKKHSDTPLLQADILADADNPDISGKKVFAFAGIGRPEKFKNTLEKAGAIIAGWDDYPDHHPYQPEDLKDFLAEAEKQEVMVITTAKDWVRLPASLQEKVKKYSIHLAWRNEKEITDLLEEALRNRLA